MSETLPVATKSRVVRTARTAALTTNAPVLADRWNRRRFTAGPPRFHYGRFWGRQPTAVLRPTILAVLLVTATAVIGDELGRVSIITQRDATGNVRVERQVRLNLRGDFENHGFWRSWTPAGELCGQGRYASGKRTGVWRRWMSADELPEATASIARGFTPPLLSQATYREGRLQGPWRLTDAADRRVLEIAFADGERHGVATVLDVSGAVVRRSRFHEGKPTGSVERLSTSGVLEVVADYVEGRQRFSTQQRHPNGKLWVSQELLGPEVRRTIADDPWQARLATYAEHGSELRHGERVVWHPSGQIQLRARFSYGKPVGEARWWRANGQLATVGNYQDGKATGQWRWWHANGLLAARADYAGGTLVGDLASWDASGRRSGEPLDSTELAHSSPDAPSPR